MRDLSDPAADLQLRVTELEADVADRDELLRRVDRDSCFCDECVTAKLRKIREEREVRHG